MDLGVAGGLAIGVTLAACGDDAGTGETSATEAVAADAAEPVEAIEPAPIVAERDGVDRYRYWSPVRAFLRARVIAGSALGSKGGIAITEDGHVGVTRDAGQNWTWSRPYAGRARVGTGWPEGPWIVAGDDGYVARSEDGTEWVSLARLTDARASDTVADASGILVIGEGGVFVHYAADGGQGLRGVFPDRFKPTTVQRDGDHWVAQDGKKAYGSKDGLAWARLSAPPPMPGGKTASTSAGLCRIDKVGDGERGVLCEVDGIAHGLGAKAAAVVQKKSISVTRDDGSTWVSGELPKAGVNGVFGAPGGPYYALGSKGLVMTSPDAVDWSPLEFEEKANMWSGLFDGKRGFMVGEGGTVLVTQDGGGSWDFAEVPYAGAFKWITREGDEYIVTDGKGAIASKDGVTWREADLVLDLPERQAACDGLPDPGRVCAYSTETTTPESFPEVSSFRFDGDRGLARGADGLVALTRDGGNSWTGSHGLGMGPVVDYAVADDRVIVTDGSRIAVTKEAGENFVNAAIELEDGKLSAIRFFGNEGGAIAAGSKGTLFITNEELEGWTAATIAGADRVDFTRIFDAGGRAFVVGSNGAWWRSEDGREFSRVEPDAPHAVVAMSGDDDEIFALSWDARGGESSLLRSLDGGRQFAVVARWGDRGIPSRFEFRDGQLIVDGEVSKDAGLSWRRFEGAPRRGEALEDGSDLWVRPARRGFAGGLTLVDEDAEKWVALDTVFARGGRVECTEDGGCWLLSEGVLYRPSP